MREKVPSQNKPVSFGAIHTCGASALLFQQHIFTQTMAAAHQWAALHYSCQHCCLLVLGLINPVLALRAPPSLRTRYCLLRLVSQVSVHSTSARLSRSFCKDELAPRLNTEASTSQLSDGVIRYLLYPAGILVMNLYAKQLFDMEARSCRRTVMTVYMLLK